MPDHLPFFLDAMGEGCAVGTTKKTSIMELPGSKVVTHTYSSAEDPQLYRIVDCWFSNGEFSGGHTTMWYRGKPVWMMHYGGWYAEAAIPFLWECLRRAYVTERRFYGGRGPACIRGDMFTYVNRYTGTFDAFQGEEGIFDLEGTCCGFHWYRGMSLERPERKA